MENPKFLQNAENAIDDEKLQEITDSIKAEFEHKMDRSNKEFINKFEVIKETAIQEALRIAEENQVKFLDKFAKSGLKNDEEMISMVSEQTKKFEK
mmetsp:Transcript_287/g.286  ORF Transcript_287/g.286 Transcript_287/m.286 type:complete len:96 (-) Transcript_287:365-652(-)